LGYALGLDLKFFMFFFINLFCNVPRWFRTFSQVSSASCMLLIILPFFLFQLFFVCTSYLILIFWLILCKWRQKKFLFFNFILFYTSRVFNFGFFHISHILFYFSKHLLHFCSHFYFVSPHFLTLVMFPFALFFCFTTFFNTCYVYFNLSILSHNFFGVWVKFLIFCWLRSWTNLLCHF